MFRNEQILQQLAYAGSEDPRHMSLATHSQIAWILDPLPRRPIRCVHLRRKLAVQANLPASWNRAVACATKAGRRAEPSLLASRNRTAASATKVIRTA